MFEFTWTPELDAQAEDSRKITHPFKGKVTLTIPKHTERLKALQKAAITVNEAGEVDKAQAIDFSISSIEFALKHIKTVALEHEDGRIFEKAEELEYDEDGGVVLQSIGARLLKGVKLSKS